VEIEEEERNQPKQVSKRLTQSETEVSDWAKKMAEFKPPERKKYIDEGEFEDDE
jgi:hypothetical protein